MMKSYYETEIGKLYHGRCQDLLKSLPDDSIDSLITDPPYGLKFMGKKWDYEVPSIEIWQECLRVLKPGGTALIFAGSRTQHRMACAIEDAGWIIKDCIMWIYGSGFPKALDISKAMDKRFGAERKNIGVAGKSGSRRNSMRGDFTGGEYMETAPSTEEAKRWNGWKSHGLKPAYEPILVCMKPNEDNYAQNALKWGVSGLNVDGCRIPIDPKADKSQLRTMTRSRKTENDGWGMNQKNDDTPQVVSPQGRYPSNVILDGSDEVEKIFPETQSGALLKHHNQNESENTCMSGKNYKRSPRQDFMASSGSASRFFKKCPPDSEQSRFIYLPKPSTAERNAGCHELLSGINGHPTIKSLALMKYLCTLTQTPTRGTVLDPFAGSGSTLVACEQIGRSWIGIEKELEYCEIARARIKQETSQLKLFR